METATLDQRVTNWLDQVLGRNGDSPSRLLLFLTPIVGDKLLVEGAKITYESESQRFPDQKTRLKAEISLLTGAAIASKYVAYGALAYQVYSKLF